MHGDLGWDQLQVMISKSTTADLLKMYYKLDEFSNQQFKSSKRVFSSLQPKHQRVNNSSFKRRQLKHRSTCEGKFEYTCLWYEVQIIETKCIYIENYIPQAHAT